MNLASLKILAQAPQIVPASPEAAALAKMINYPVNLNTGVPDISVPLYQIESGGLNLPITLNYHAGGFKINELATSVGMGWSLSSDIQISRAINGIDDFDPTKGYISNIKMKAYFSQYGDCIDCGYPFGVGMSDYAIASGEMDGMPDKFNYKLMNKAGSFYFRKTSTGGTGYVIVPVPYDNIKIEYNDRQFIITDTDGTIYTFGTQGILDPADDLAQRGFETSGSGTNTSLDAIITWKCKKIENASRTENITFSYQSSSRVIFDQKSDYIEYYTNDNRCTTGNTSAQNAYNSVDLTGPTNTQDLLTANTNFQRFFELNSPRYIEGSGNFANLTIPYINSQNQFIKKGYAMNTSLGLSAHYSRSTVNRIALSDIQFRGGRVLFLGFGALAEIKILNANNEEIRIYRFFQSFTEPGNLAAAKTYNGQEFSGTNYLDSIQVVNNNKVFSRYSFLYKDKYCFGSHLRGQDAWGYPNSSTREKANDFSFNASTSAVPMQQVVQAIDKILQRCFSPITSTFSIGGSSIAETPDKNYAQRGILKRIIYPTGGFVDFNYEANMYNETVYTSGTESQAVRMGGGLRINSIDYYNGDSMKPVSQKYYRYGELEDGIGLHINKPLRASNGNNYNPFYYSQNITYYNGTAVDALGNPCSDGGCLNFLAKEKVTTYLPASSMNYNYPTGAPIYYTKVTEYQNDMGLNTGKSVYGYYLPEKFQPNYISAQNNVIQGTNIQLMQTDGLMGAQKYLEEYKFENGRFKLIHSKNFEYIKYQKAEQVRVVYSFFKNIYRVSGYNGRSQESLYWDPNYQNGGTHQGRYDDYNSGQYGIAVGRLLLSKETEKWVNNADTLFQRKQFYYDDALYLQPSRIVTSNTVGNEIIKYIKYPYNLAGVDIYDQMKSKNMISVPIEEQVYNNSLSKELSRAKTNFGQINVGPGFISPVSIQKSIKGNLLSTEITFDSYDQYGNLLQVTGKDKLIKSYVWGYGNKYPVAEVSGATYNSVSGLIDITALQSLSNEQQLRNTLSLLRNNLPDAMVSSFTYAPFFGMTSQTAPNGKNKFFDYDGVGRLITEKNHSGYVTMHYEYKETGIVSSLARSAFSSSTPVMQSFGKYCPPFGYVPQNRILLGGTINGPGEVYMFAESAEDALLNGNVSYLETNGDCSESTQTATVTLKQFMNQGGVIPNYVNFDLIQDKSVVSSRRFPYGQQTQSQFYVKQGVYQAGMRHVSNYNGSNLKYYVQPSNGSGFYLKPGDAITFAAGINYDITISNAL